MPIKRWKRFLAFFWSYQNGSFLRRRWSETKIFSKQQCGEAWEFQQNCLWLWKASELLLTSPASGSSLFRGVQLQTQGLQGPGEQRFPKTSRAGAHRSASLFETIVRMFWLKVDFDKHEPQIHHLAEESKTKNIAWRYTLLISALCNMYLPQEFSGSSVFSEKIQTCFGLSILSRRQPGKSAAYNNVASSDRCLHDAKRSLKTGKIWPDMTKVLVQRKVMVENRGGNTSLKITKICSTMHKAGED